MRHLLLICLLLSLSASAHAHRITVRPYLQNPTPTSMVIAWETVDGETSVVQWGEGEVIDREHVGEVKRGPGAHRYHWVQLDALQPGTRYAYRVVIDGEPGPTYHFKTAPAPEDEAPFRLVAMSDMQQDFRLPNQYREIVEDGVIAFTQGEFGDHLSEEIGLVLVPGDLVAEGPEHASWADTFFGPGEALMSEVPFLPVPGNHERDVEFFFDYFHLPQNGTPGFEEHWWYTDYSNVRIIGLDSNREYRIQAQLDWLDQVLADACASDHLDFVFAQLHHPFESELWPVGNTAYTGSVIERLETFSTGCSKPSIHFFGHTHGYARGQSRDHHHLMVNVASAGGNIDYWGEYSQTDYDTFTVSQDEYGFVIVEIEAGPEPRFQLRRVTRGDAFRRVNNVVSDEVKIRLLNSPPAAPLPRGELDQPVNPDCLGLAIQPFSDTDGDAHQASHWQVSADCEDFTEPVADDWIQRHNWYEGVDRQADDDLEDVTVVNLAPDSSYCWRARVRDDGFSWSDWSIPERFETGSSSRIPLALENPGGEAGVLGWIVEDGVFESVSDGECNGTTPRAGDRYFAVGGVCESSEIGRVSQTISVEAFRAAVTAGELTVEYGAYVRNFDGADHPQVALRFLGPDGAVLEERSPIGSRVPVWSRVEGRAEAPPQTHELEIVLIGRRNAGTDNDSYFDDVFVNVVTDRRQVCDEPPAPRDETDMGAPTMDAMLSDAEVVADAALEHPPPQRELDAGTVLDAQTDNRGDSGVNILQPDLSVEDLEPRAGDSGCATMTVSKRGTPWAPLVGFFAAFCLWQRMRSRGLRA